METPALILDESLAVVGKTPARPFRVVKGTDATEMLMKIDKQRGDKLVQGWYCVYWLHPLKVPEWIYWYTRPCFKLDPSQESIATPYDLETVIDPRCVPCQDIPPATRPLAHVMMLDLS